MRREAQDHCDNCDRCLSLWGKARAVFAMLAVTAALIGATVFAFVYPNAGCPA